jgi:hypothetical protein
MPTPETQTPRAVRQLDEAGASGGAPAEAKPPQDPREYVLVTVEPDGKVKAQLYDSLAEAAQKMLEDMEEVVAAELTQQLPLTASYWEASSIAEDNHGKMYIVVKKWDRWEAVYKIPAHKATLYMARDEVLSSMTGLKLYVKARALVTRGTAFYRIEVGRAQVKDLVAELMFLMGESP